MAINNVQSWSETAASNTEIGTTNIDEGCQPSGINNAIRTEMAQIAAWTGDDTIASATTTDLSTVNGQYVTVTGTTTITGFGTVKAGWLKFLKFSGALTLTHNATSLILPGAANIKTVAGDTAIFVSQGSGNWRCLNYQFQNSTWVPIASDVLSSVAAWTATNLDAYRALRITGQLTGATDGVAALLTTSSNNGASYDSSASDYSFQTITVSDASVTAFRNTAASGLAFMPVSGNSNSEGSNFEIVVQQFNLNRPALFRGQTHSVDASGFDELRIISGRRVSSTARNAIRIAYSSGDIAIGRILLEGLR